MNILLYGSASVSPARWILRKHFRPVDGTFRPSLRPRWLERVWTPGPSADFNKTQTLESEYWHQALTFISVDLFFQLYCLRIRVFVEKQVWITGRVSPPGWGKPWRDQAVRWGMIPSCWIYRWGSWRRCWLEQLCCSRRKSVSRNNNKSLVRKELLHCREENSDDTVTVNNLEARALSENMNRSWWLEVFF